MSALTLQIKDETAGGKVYNSIDVVFSSEMVTVKDIIEKRVVAEVEQYNSKLPEYYNGLVQPTEAEKTLNGFKLKEKKKVDVEKQVYAALNAFNNNGYFVLIDNIQAESLEQMVVINSNTIISFIKLTPLVGG
jgi:hypothetical protein